MFQGGQYYFSDEQRYQTSQEIVEFLVDGQLREASRQLLQMPEHLGYKVIGVVPAYLESVVKKSNVLPAMYFSSFSVINLCWIFLLARKLGASPSEALLALFFASLSQSLFYYSRHLVPYDVAMTFGLIALYVGLSDDPGMRTSISCGVLGYLCFITYNGYWPLTGLAMLVHILRGGVSFPGMFRKGILSAAGSLLPLLLLTACAVQLGIDLPGEFSRFAQTVTQGAYEEGWSLPFAYFWHAEHFLFISFLLLAGYAVLRRNNRRAIRLWAGSTVFLYLCLAVPSAVFHEFVVLGRLARQIMPFLILLSANGLMGLLQSAQFGRRIGLVVMLAVMLQGTVNFNVSLRVSFPKDFVRDVQARYPDFNFSPKRFLFGAPEICENNGYAMQNAKYFLTAPKPPQTIPGEVLLAASHPINFLPYQYEGYTPETRQAFRSAQLEMTFYRLDLEFIEQTKLRQSGILSCMTK